MNNPKEPVGEGRSPDRAFGPRSKEFSKDFIYRRALFSCFDMCVSALPLDIEPGNYFSGSNAFGMRVNFDVRDYELMGRKSELVIEVVYLEDAVNESNSRSRMFEVKYEKTDGVEFTLEINNLEFLVEEEDIKEKTEKTDIDDLIFLKENLKGLRLEQDA